MTDPTSVGWFADSLGMAALAMGSVALWTVRVALAARGRKFVGAGVAAVEALVFALAFTHLAAALDAPERVGGYGLGVAAGTLLGLAADERLTRSRSEVRAVVPGSDLALVDHLHSEGWPVTWSSAGGPDGTVTMLFVALDDRHAPDVVAELRALRPGAFVTVHRLGAVHAAAPEPTPTRRFGSRCLHPTDGSRTGRSPVGSSSRRLDAGREG
jgi:uncharacterized protein YebE (UPF0316 family)